MADPSAIHEVKRQLERSLPNAQFRTIQRASNTSFTDMLGVFRTNPPRMGAKEMAKSYSTMPWLRAVVDKIGSSMATMTWRVFTKAKIDSEGKRTPVPYRQLAYMSFDDRKKEMIRLRSSGELVEIEDHPLIDSLYSAGPTFSGFTTRELTQKYIDLVGEGFWIKERGPAGKPINFIPVPPHWVSDTPNNTNGFFLINPPGAATPQMVRAEDMIWFYHPDPDDPYQRGSGMGVTLGDELETDEYAAKFMKVFFYNSARPDVLISSPGLKREDTVRFEKRFVDKLRGWSRAFLPFFMNRDIKIHELNTDYSHLQMLDLRKHQRDSIIQVFGIPPEVLGIVEASNRATSEVAEYLYARWVLVPRLEFMRQILQHNLVPEYDDRLILDYDSPVAQDKEHILKVATIAPFSLLIDEWRIMQGRLPLPDGQGQVIMKPLNYEAVLPEDLKEPWSQQQPGSDGEPSDGPPPEEDPPDGEDPEDDVPEDGVEESLIRLGRHWPELVVNTISRQRVAPSIGTRKEQIKNLLRKSLSTVAEQTTVLYEELEVPAEENGPDLIRELALSQDSFNSAMAPLSVKLGSLFTLAGEQATFNLAMFADLTDKDQIEYFSRLHGAVEEAMASVKSALSESLEVGVELFEEKQMEADESLLFIIDCIGIRASDVSQLTRSAEEDDLRWRLEELFLEEMADHLIAHMSNAAQEALWATASTLGVLPDGPIARTWITRLGCRDHPVCKEMDGKIAGINGEWELPNGDTVVTPTMAHAECHCTEQLVRKEVQREAAE